MSQFDLWFKKLQKTTFPGSYTVPCNNTLVFLVQQSSMNIVETSAKGQQSPEIQWSCTESHTLRDISLVSMSDFIHEFPFHRKLVKI